MSLCKGKTLQLVQVQGCQCYFQTPCNTRMEFGVEYAKSLWANIDNKLYYRNYIVKRYWQGNVFRFSCGQRHLGHQTRDPYDGAVNIENNPTNSGLGKSWISWNLDKISVASKVSVNVVSKSLGTSSYGKFGQYYWLTTFLANIIHPAYTCVRKCTIYMPKKRFLPNPCAGHMVGIYRGSLGISHKQKIGRVKFLCRIYVGTGFYLDKLQKSWGWYLNLHHHISSQYPQIAVQT